jgi:peptidoglycan/LPS O-acetylase OafA/YrhL
MGTVSLWNDPAWSLSAEWLAYIFFPMAFLAASNIAWGFKPLAETILLLAMFLILAAAAHADGK